MALMACSASVRSRNARNPYPLDLPVLASHMTLALEVRVNWAYQNTNTQKEDLSQHYHLFVGDLSPEVACSASVRSRNARNPYPLDLPVLASHMTLASERDPNAETGRIRKTTRVFRSPVAVLVCRPVAVLHLPR
jgi:hypothetical protein